MTLQRTRLLARLFASEPRLVRLSAPPGYGKSSLVRLFARRFERHSTCDCSGVSDVADFAARALAALAAESQGSDSLMLVLLRLHATEADAAAWSRALLEAWKARREHALLILEHAESIAENGAVLALLGDLLAARPAERVMLISSRVALPLRLAHYVAPHQILTLTRNELRFEAEEAAAIFEGTELASDVVKRIVRLADGSPILLLLLALVAQYDAGDEHLIDRLDATPAVNLHEHLANDVLSAFTPDMLAAMLAAAAIPNATLEDIAAATGIRHATPIVDRLLRLPGFLSAESGAYQTHPLLLGALRARYGNDLTGYLFRAAQDYEGSGDFLRAAELYSAFGDTAAAAAALDRLPAADFQAPSARLIDALRKITMSIVRTHPNLWIATLPHRRQNVDASALYDEALRLLESVEPGPSGLARRLRVRLAVLAQELEKLGEARALLEGAAGADAPEEQRLVLMTTAVIAAKRGRFAEADRLADEADAVAGARHLRFESERAQIVAEKARLLGDWPDVLKTNEEALYTAQRSGLTSRIIGAARSVAEAAWYCNDDARETAANQMLEDCGDGEVRVFARRVETALARGPVDAPARTLPLVRWHAALTTTDIEHAGDLFDSAVEDVDALENLFLRIALRVSAALLLQSQRRRLLEARVIAQHIESPPLQASLELLIDSPEPSDYGIFRELAARVARSPLKVRQDLLYVDIVRGQVRRGSELLPVSDRGLELLAALALLPAGTSKEDVAAAIWPSLDGEGALNTLKMCVSRTRAQIAEKEAIRSTRRGYTLSERVAIDVREFESLLRGNRGTETLPNPVRRQILETIRTLQGRERAYTAAWSWFAPHASRLDALQRDLNAIVMSDALSRELETSAR